MYLSWTYIFRGHSLNLRPFSAYTGLHRPKRYKSVGDGCSPSRNTYILKPPSKIH